MGEVTVEKRLNEIVEGWWSLHVILCLAYMSNRHFYCLRVKLFVFSIFKSIIIFIIKGIKITDTLEFIYMYFIFFLQNLEKLLRKTIYAY